MKVCIGCDKELTLDEFGTFTRRNKKEHFTRCKSCRVIQVHERRLIYRDSWIAFFNNHYGVSPRCQICDKSLEYLGGDLLTSVCFDHRTGRESIKIGPSTWCFIRPCTPENQNVFLSCDFGILCRHCNSSMPTNNRSVWLRRALEYSQND